MPGNYAHITAVNIASEKRSLVRVPDFPREAIDYKCGPGRAVENFADATIERDRVRIEVYS